LVTGLASGLVDLQNLTIAGAGFLPGATVSIDETGDRSCRLDPTEPPPAS
jgi:hypothetical protein